jgi:hypothetical protein
MDKPDMTGTLLRKRLPQELKRKVNNRRVMGGSHVKSIRSMQI